MGGEVLIRCNNVMYIKAAERQPDDDVIIANQRKESTCFIELSLRIFQIIFKHHIEQGYYCFDLEQINLVEGRDDISILIHKPVYVHIPLFSFYNTLLKIFD